MFETREIRWFFQTNDSQISKWFEENNYSFGKTDPRTDYYLTLDKEDPGIKLREGKIEIKNRINRSEKEELGNAEGYFEEYQKWSFSSSEDDSLYQEIVQKNKYNWIPLAKERLSFKLKEDENNRLVKADPEEYLSSGCQIEYTRVKLKNQTWFTFGLEWFGGKELDLNPSFVNEIMGNTKLKAENSMGYAEFLKTYAH